MAEDQVTKKQIIDDLIADTQSLFSETYDEGNLSKWSYKVQNSLKAIFTEQSVEFGKVKYWLDKLPKPRSHYSGFSIVEMQKSVDELFSLPERPQVIKNVLGLLQAYAYGVTISDQFRQTNTTIGFSQDFFKYLQDIGMHFEETSLTLYLNDLKKVKCYPNERNELVNSRLRDPFFEKLQFEINISWRLGLFTSTLVLSRKYIENLVIEILKKKFPPRVSSDNIKLFYVEKQHRFQHFSVLLDKLESKKIDFAAEEHLVEKFLKEVKPFRWDANAAAHSIVESPKEEDIRMMNIQEIVTILEMIFTSL